MGKGFVDKVLGMLGVRDDEIDDAEVEQHEPEDYEAETEPRGGSRKLVSLPGHRQTRLVITEPKSFEEVTVIAEHLKSRRPVIVNISNVDKGVGMRILDFMSGTAYALGGESQKIGEGIFLFTPSNFEISQHGGQGQGGVGMVLNR